jgi:excisionase family DNA binding protein
MPDSLQPPIRSSVVRGETSDPALPLVLSAGDLARELGISTRTIRRLDLEGKLPAPVRIGRAVRWPRQIIVEWIAAGAPSRLEWETNRGTGRRPLAVT